MYTYRSLRSEEFYNNMVLCKEYFDYSPLLDLPAYNEYFGDDALDLVGAHITKGNKTVTPWISCTKSYDRVKHYLYDKDDFVHGLAVIKNHENDQFASDYFFYLLNQYHLHQITYELLVARIRRIQLVNIKKCVLDFSTGKSSLFDAFIKCGLVHFCDGRIRPYMTRWEYNYSQSNDEVLVLGQIPKNDVFILDPLKIDLIEYLQKINIIDGFNEELLDSIIDILRINHSLFVCGDIRIEEILTEPLKSTYLNLPFEYQIIFTNLYVFEMTKESYMRRYNVSQECLEAQIEYILIKIINSSEYLISLTRTENHKQIFLTNS